MSSIPFILDTDTAQDDCVTIMLGVLDSRADLKAITMVAGNVGFERQTVNAVMTLNAVGKLGDVPIHQGCSQPMMRPWKSAEEVHGDGAGGLAMEVPKDAVSREHGVDALLRLTAEQPGELTIVCIGPLTNIATAIVKDRSFVSRVKALYIMGGSNNGRGNITPSAEFNFYVDPEAAKIVFDAGFEKIVVVDWDPVTIRDATYTRQEYNKLTSIDTPAARFFKRVCDTTLEFNESVGIDGSTHPDSLTLATLLYPELIIEQNEYRVDIETSSELTRGYAQMAWAKFKQTPNAIVVERADKDAFYQLLTTMLQTKTTPNIAIEGINNESQ